MFYRFILIFILFCTGCGYHFRRGDALYPDIKNIFIEVVRNNTREAGIEKYFTSSLYDEFTKSKVFPLVSKENADAVLETTLMSYSVGPVFFDPNGRAIEYRINVIIRAVLRNKNSMIIFDSGEISEEDNYFVAEENVIDIKRNEYETLDIITRNTAEEIHDLIVGERHE